MIWKKQDIPVIRLAFAVIGAVFSMDTLWNSLVIAGFLLFCIIVALVATILRGPKSDAKTSADKTDGSAETVSPAENNGKSCSQETV